MELPLRRAQLLRVIAKAEDLRLQLRLQMPTFQDEQPRRGASSYSLRRYSPLRPPRFSISRMSLITMPRSTALHMS